MIEPPGDRYGNHRGPVSRLTALALLAFASAACSHPRAEDIEAVLAEYDEAAADLGWPGFDATGIPLILYDDATTYLIRHPAPPEPFREMRGAEAVWVADTLFSGLSANTDADFVGVRTAVAGVPEDWPPRETAALLMHEAFHAYQSVTFPDWTANEVDLFTYPIRSARLLQLRRLEGGALRRAISAPDSVRELCWGQAFLRARADRAARLPDESAAYDRASELREGLARYVQARVLGTEPAVPADGFPPEDVRERAYEVGHATAVLLDRLAPNWKRELVEAEGPSSLEQLLDSAIGGMDVRHCGPNRDELARATSVARSDSASLATRDRRALDGFVNAAGWSIEVVSGRDALQPQMFDPLNLRVLSDSEVLHTRWVTVANEAVEAEVLDRTALTRGRPGHPLFAGIDRFLVTGLTEPELVESGDTIRIAEPGLTITAIGASIERDGQQIRILAPR